VPSLGEGCNTALESAVTLADCVGRDALMSRDTLSCADLSEALKSYSRLRMPLAKEVCVCAVCVCVCVRERVCGCVNKYVCVCV